MRTFKGFTWLPAMILILIMAVGILILGLGRGGSGNGGGKGEDVGPGDAVEAEATIQTTTEEVTTSEIEYVEVTVSGSSYIFNNTTYEMEDIDSLMPELKSDDEIFTVRLSDENASARAYEELTARLIKEKIRYIEVSR
ncbi:MAG: hypothetical protein NC078_11605 [Ruminococcus sp.]|nr:hypothetical protein [Ruminococcus sp.]